MSIPASHRARRVTGTLAQAEALADLIRDHGHPARVVVGRKRGTIRIRAARTRGQRRAATMLPCDRPTVAAWLDITRND